MTRWKDGIYIRTCCNVWKSRSCLPNRVTLISFVVGAKFRSPVPDRRRCSPFKENLLFPTGTIRSKRISVRMENDFFPVFSPFFFFFLSPYQLNELFFIRRQRYAISAIPFFVASLTSILSLERTFSPPLLFFFSSLFFFIFASFFFPLFFDSSPPGFLSSPLRIIRGWSATVLLSLFFAPFSLLSSLHLHLLKPLVRFLVFPRSFLFLNSYRRFSPSQFHHFFPPPLL